MAENKFENARSNFISVVVNFKNLRFMTLVKENCIISDLIKEVENTFVELYSVNVKIKTLRNALNAVLPHWYPVAPLLKNQDEVFAFTDSAADEFNNVTNNGNLSKNTATLCTTSPSGSGAAMADSGFTSPVMKLGTPGTSEENTGQREKTGINEALEASQEGNDLNRIDENLSQDEGNELLSETFSLKVNPRTAPKQKDEIPVESMRSKSGKSLKRSTDDENESSLKVKHAKLGITKTFATGRKTKSAPKESVLPDSSRNANGAVVDSSYLEDKEKNFKNSNDVAQISKDISKSNDKTDKEEGNDSSSDSSDESSSDSDDSSKKTNDAKKTSDQKSSAVTKNANTKNINTLTRSTNTSSKTGQKTPQKNLALGTNDGTDSSEDWTDDESMDADQKNEKSDNKAVSRTVKTDTDSLKKRADLSRSSVEKTKPNENTDVNVEKPDKENEKSRVNAPVVPGVASDSRTAKKSCRRESITSDDSSEDSGTVDDIKNKEVEETTVDDTAVGLNILPDGKSNVPEVSDSKDKEIKGSTLIIDKSKKKTKKSSVDKVLIQDSSMSEIASGSVSADMEKKQVTDIDTQESNTAKKGMRKKNAGSNENKTSGKIVEVKVKSVSNVGKNSNTLDTKKQPEITGKDKSDKVEDHDSSNDSSSSSGDSDQSSDETSKKPKHDTEKQQIRGSSKAGLISKNENVSENAKKVENISPKASGKETANVQDSSLSKKEENSKGKKSSEEVDVSSDSDSTWSSEEEVGTKRKQKTSKNLNETKIGNEKVQSQTGNKKDEEQTDVVDGDKSKARSSSNGKGKSKATRKTATAPKNSSKSETESGSKSKSKRENAKLPPSPAKSVGYQKITMRGKKPVSPFKSVVRIAKSVSTKNKANSTKAKKIEVQVSSDDEDSKSTVSTLKAPFTQVPAKDKMKSSDDDQSKSVDDLAKEDGAEVGEKDKVKRKQKYAADDKTGNAAAHTPPNEEQTGDPNTSLQLPRTPKSSSRKSAALLSASKVSQWLLSNPVSEDVAEMSGSERGTQKKSITCSKNKTTENKMNMESLVDNNIPASPSQSQKRKADEVSQQGISTNSKKSKKKKRTEDEKKEEIQQVDGETQEKQEKPSAKRPVRSNKGKKSSLSSPKISKGLSALAQDDTDCSIKSGRNSKRRKLAAVTRRMDTSGFLTPSKTVRRKPAMSSKNTKSSIKKVLSSQPSKTVEMNAREKEFLDSGVANLDTLLNDESIKW